MFKGNKELGEESIRLFLVNPISRAGFVLPKPIQNQCAVIVSMLCNLLLDEEDTTTDDDDDRQRLLLLYNSCRETLLIILKSIAFANRSTYFGFTDGSRLIILLDPVLYKLSNKLKSYTNTLSGCSRSSFVRDVCDFAIVSLHMRKAVEEHVKFKGQSLPLCVDINFKDHPCYLYEIGRFYRIFQCLNEHIVSCLRDLNVHIHDDARGQKFNPMWSYYLSLLKELKNISKLYQGAENKLSACLEKSWLMINYIIVHAKRRDEHQWILESKVALNFESRIRLMTMMFPMVKNGEQKLHKIIIDRSQLLTDSFEQIGYANPKLLRNGLSVVFKHEVSTGPGVLMEWLFMVLQDLFNPQNSFFLACPSDQRRFFPNPDPCMYKSCKDILEMDVDFIDSDAMGLTFIYEIEEFGSRKVVELCPGGNTIAVTSKNREEYVNLLIQHCFIKSIAEKVAYFVKGFGDILCNRRLQKVFFRSLELNDLDVLLLGKDKAICVKDWKAHTEYNDYKETDDQICWFWKVVEGMSMDQQRELLFFWTSVKYLPVNGFSGLSRLYIYKTKGSHYHLPSSHTCFHRLGLPHYPSMDVMQQRLFVISQEHVECSFGL